MPAAILSVHPSKAKAMAAAKAQRAAGCHAYVIDGPSGARLIGLATSAAWVVYA